ncbi:MAG TPA: hypothetical protein VEB21_06520 [Terriglobales bacterium]|nr:hypothetical protein [Terriglobales bacterium]
MAKATDVRFVGHRAGDGATTLLRLAIPTLGEAAPQLFKQLKFWDTPGPTGEQTAFELLAGSLIDIGSRRKDSERFDAPMLQRIGSCRRWLHTGLSAVTLPDSEVTSIARIDDEIVRAAEDLASAVPAPKRVRLTGRLDLIGVSQRVLKIHVGGNVVAVVWEGIEPIHDLRELLNHDVVLEGDAIFRPSGALLRVDATALAPAASDDEFFRTMPSPNVPVEYSKLATRNPNQPSVFKTIRGWIPADESDEEFAAALAAMR